MAAGQVWVELVGELVVARIRAEPTVELLREPQEKMLFLVRDAGRGKVLVQGGVTIRRDELYGATAASD